MDAYHLSPESDHLTELVGRAESVDVERDRRVVARIVPVAKVEQAHPFDWPAYSESIKDMTICPANSVVDMRKEARC